MYEINSATLSGERDNKNLDNTEQIDKTIVRN